MKGVGVDAEGSAESLISLWDENLFKVHSCISNKRCIILVGELFSVKKYVAFCNVYAPNFENERRSLWDFLVVSQGSLQVPWCLGRDFNTILDPSKRNSGLINMGSIWFFNDFILKAQVIDLPA
ncbi:hypothetical protein Dsin_022967 [Dipteronia sinensis]|uniref:Uncharacterized protein n=1 Tax=Dipteronia sinensis TaxID=43782 RepID=A0AAE0A3G4_9ROSI|nr:hypothetical protein Dsin_022967 [Dipteronia sinensis]